jgi:hypothetical protein
MVAVLPLALSVRPAGSVPEPIDQVKLPDPFVAVQVAE